MKKIFIILAALFACSFSSCKEIVYVDSNTGEVVTPTTVSSPSDFCNLVLVATEAETHIYVDTHSDVLYLTKETFSYKFGITPIFEADGTCLTYTEWKARNKKQ